MCRKMRQSTAPASARARAPKRLDPGKAGPSHAGDVHRRHPSLRQPDRRCSRDAAADFLHDHRDGKLLAEDGDLLQQAFEVVVTFRLERFLQLAAEGKGPFQWKTIPQGSATSVWAAVVAPADEVGGKYCENCHAGKLVAEDAPISVISEGVRAYALDPGNAEALWKKSEEMVGETF